MSRLRLPLVLLAALALLLAACSDDDSGDDATGDSETEIDLDSLEDGELPPLPEFEEPDDGVAATVGGTDIPVSTVESIVAEIAADPVAAEQLEGDDGDYYRSELRAQLLNQLVIQEIIIQGAADDYGIALTDEALAQAEADAIELEGGQEAFDALLEDSGLSIDTFRSLQLPLAAILVQLEAEFGDLTVPEDAEPGTSTEALDELQQWGQEKFDSADVQVAEAYGSWNAELGQVQPPGTPQASDE